MIEKKKHFKYRLKVKILPTKVLIVEVFSSSHV